MRLHSVHVTALLLLWPLTAAAHDTGESCWSREDECIIRATLQRAQPSTVVALPMEIDCLHLSDSESSDATKAEFLLRPSEGEQHALLDGCHTPPFRTTTYGLELLPGCEQIQEVTVQRFRGDVLQNFHCGSTADIRDAHLQVLLVRNNEISSIAASSLTNLTLLRELHFSGNSLRHIEDEAFDALPALERLQLQQEHLLVLRQSNVLERAFVSDVHLSSLKRVTSQLFEHLPRILRSLYVAHTPIDNGTVTLLNPQQVRNATLVDCGLRVFTLIDDYGSVLLLNLSGNAIEELRWQVKSDNASVLQLLDLSENSLVSLPWHWLRPLGQLRQLLLRGNLLKTLSLSKLLMTVPTARLVDLRGNKLVALRDTDTAQQLHYTHTRIQIDHNPWNCLWLLNFAHSHPEQFRIFQYDKFISQINVNGLACVPEERLPADISLHHSDGSNDEVQPQPPPDEKSPTPTEAALLNVSTYTLVYGNPWDIKRNQRAEALIIVFMLPLGIAFLFLLLYMWIHCQRMFHLSYYSSFPLIGIRHAPNGPLRSADRFDVVRQLPSAGSATALTGPNNNEGYEMPLDGLSPVCNCPNHATANGGVGSKCLKPHHHITYVAIPAEQPYKIYEEILEEHDDAQRPDVAALAQHTTAALYDHLSFEDPNVDGDM